MEPSREPVPATAGRPARCHPAAANARRPPTKVRRAVSPGGRQCKATTDEGLARGATRRPPSQGDHLRRSGARCHPAPALARRPPTKVRCAVPPGARPRKATTYEGPARGATRRPPSQSDHVRGLVWRCEASRVNLCRLGGGAPRSWRLGLYLEWAGCSPHGHGRALFSPAFSGRQASRQRLKVKPQSQPRTSSRPAEPPSQGDHPHGTRPTPLERDKRPQADPRESNRRMQRDTPPP
ncbi:hypothetical protein SAMN04488564_102373 [Lentzea waywayandensis]|uniref:Uncharacterized protein n=1 Tax=Lentzea waywayandensis TaxID=84724 RepID=A0A1I6DEA5_9PSEU|nr:hypothetical protein SAMN04488564_102373 [Lentzea waywayandensis]